MTRQRDETSGEGRVAAQANVSSFAMPGRSSEPPASIAHLVATYARPVVSVAVDGDEVPIGEFAARVDAPVHVITAWNPGDERPDEQHNRAQQQRLAGDLDRLGVAYLPAIGRDPGSDHAEDSWAVVGLDRQDAVALGRRYGQVAIFEVTPGLQTVVGCEEPWTASRALDDRAPTSAVLLDALAEYRRARRALLSTIGVPASNRDPLAEFSERIVAVLTGGELAQNRVQKGWDVTAPDGARIQVRYLANPGDRWVNEHLVDFRGDCDSYALVVFEALDPKSVVMFTRNGLEAVCESLGKRHGDRDVTLQLTRRNYLQLTAEADRFADLGVTVFRLARDEAL